MGLFSNHSLELPFGAMPVAFCSGAHKFNMICLLEAFLDSSIPTNDERLNMKGYKLRSADNPSDSKKGGVGIYYK